MTELALAKRKLVRKNSGQGRGNLPLTRKYVREVVEQKDRGGNPLGNVNEERIARLRASDPNDMRDRIENLAWDGMNERVEARMRRTGEDYGTALRQEVHGDESFHPLPNATIPDTDAEMREAAEERMRQRPEYYGEDSPAPTTSDTARDDELRRAARERGYDV